MKILVLANNDVGLYNFRKELLERLLEEKHSVSIALPGGEKVIKMMQMGCVFYQVEIDRRGMNPFKDIMLVREYFRLIRRVRPDVVLTYTIKPNIYGGLLCRILHKKYIANITGWGTAVENGGNAARAILCLYKAAIKKAFCVFFQNKANMKKITESGTICRHIRLIPGSGVNLKVHVFEPYPGEQEKLTFLFLGRVMKNKGIEEFFDAAIEVKKLYPKADFQIAGDCEGDYSLRLKELERKGILTYLGFRSDIHDLIRQSSAIVLPSYHEGMANVLLEAAAAGRPVIASRVSGCLETFDEGVTGLGVEAGSAESLREALCRFIELPYEEKRQMGSMARKKMEDEFDRKMVVDAYIDELNKLV